jgi:hypothetical protein
MGNVHSAEEKEIIELFKTSKIEDLTQDICSNVYRIDRKFFKKIPYQYRTYYMWLSEVKRPKSKYDLYSIPKVHIDNDIVYEILKKSNNIYMCFNNVHVPSMKTNTIFEMCRIYKNGFKDLCGNSIKPKNEYADTNRFNELIDIVYNFINQVPNHELTVELEKELESFKKYKALPRIIYS